MGERLRSRYVRSTSDQIRPRSHRKPPQRRQGAPRQEKTLLRCLTAASKLPAVLTGRLRRIRLAMISDNSSASIEAFVKANVKRGATLLTDGHKSYPGLTGYRHDPRVVGKMAAHIVLPWVHRAFSLMRRWSLGTYHG